MSSDEARTVLEQVSVYDRGSLEKGDTLLHLRLTPTQNTPTGEETGSAEAPPMMNRFYLYAYRYASNANLISVQLPETWYYRTEAHNQLMRHNGPQMESLLRSALGRAVGEALMNESFDADTQAWAQAPSITAEGFQQRFESGMRFNVRGSIQGVGAGIRYNMAGFSVSTAYTSQNQGLEAIRLSRPFWGDWERGEFGVDSNGGLWLNYVGRW